MEKIQECIEAMIKARIIILEKYAAVIDAENKLKIAKSDHNSALQNYSLKRLAWEAASKEAGNA